VLEKHHKVQVLDEALEAAVRLSHRYIPARQLPDKSVSLLDTACARVAISQHAVPAEVDDCRKRIEALETELEIIARETAVGVDTAEREAAATEKLDAQRAASASSRRAGKRRRRWSTRSWSCAPSCAGAAAPSRGAADPARAGGCGGDGRPETAPRGRATEASERARRLLAELRKALQPSCAAHQGETPLILPTVDAAGGGLVVEDWTGIPVGRMVKNEARRCSSSSSPTRWSSASSASATRWR
jgi:type VI secretion system protein VasG